MRFAAKDWQNKASILGLPMVLGVLWACLWGVIQALSTVMDALQGQGDGFLYVIGQAVTYHLFLTSYVGVTILPATGWYLSWWKVKGEKSKKIQAMALLGGMVMPVIVGLALLAAGSAFSVWAERAWAEWHNLRFAESQIVGMSLIVGFAGYLVRRKKRSI